MNIQPGNPLLSIATHSYHGSVVPGAASCTEAFPRERFSVVWCALAHIVQSGKSIASIFSAIGQLQYKMAVSSSAVVRRYNKWQQSDSKLVASPHVYSHCAWRYVPETIGD